MASSDVKGLEGLVPVRMFHQHLLLSGSFSASFPPASHFSPPSHQFPLADHFSPCSGEKWFLLSGCPFRGRKTEESAHLH